MLKRIFRIFLYIVVAVLGLVAILVLVTVVPVDRSPLREQPFYSEMMQRLDSASRTMKNTRGPLTVGYNVVDLIPPFPVATAGYGNRRGRNYTVIHDSIFVRSIVIDNGVERVAIVSADLLIIPPSVTAVLEKRLPEIGFNLGNTYLNATHTHNSIGNWAEGAASLLYGSYKDTVVNFIAGRIIESVKAAASSRKGASLRFGVTPVPSAVRHRIDGTNGHLDSLMRVVEIHRDDSTKLVAVSFNAHPTCLFSRDLGLSRDYPGALVDGLEKAGYDFAMFLSGAVGSHGCNPPEYGAPCIPWMANELLDAYRKIDFSAVDAGDSVLSMVRLPLELGEPQLKIARDWRLRPWVFRSALAEYQSYITCLRVGNILLMGTPCDFAGELRRSVDTAVEANGCQAIITSFNGHYIGYITNDKYYDRDHYETRLMNWYGPGNGAYLSECLSRLAETASQDHVTGKHE